MPANNPKNASDILKSLHGFIVSPEEDVTMLPAEQIQQYLKSEGIDTTPLVHQVRQRIGKLKAERELAEARSKRLSCINNLRQPPGGASAPTVKEKIQEMIQKLTSGNPELAAVYFRKFEESNDGDLETLLEDLTLLEDMDEEDVANKSR